MSIPGPERLLDLLSRQMTSEDIRLIAAHDRGSAEERLQHEAKLREVLSGNYLIQPQRDYWYPLEVLELARWSDPEQAGVPMRSFWQTKSQDHRVRALCCALTLRITGEPGEPWQTYPFADEATMIRLLESILFLQEETLAAGREYFFWLADTEPYRNEPDLFLLLIVLFLRLQNLPQADINSPVIEKVAAILLKLLAPKKCSDIGQELAKTSDPEKWKTLALSTATLIEALQPDMLSALYELQTHLHA